VAVRRAAGKRWPWPARGLFLATSQRGELLSDLWVNKISARSQCHTVGPVYHTGGPIIPFHGDGSLARSIGTHSVIRMPLHYRHVPFIARLVETRSARLDSGSSSGAGHWGRPRYRSLSTVLPCQRRWPGITLGLTLAIVSLIGYSAMVGAGCGEGLGDLGHSLWAPHNGLCRSYAVVCDSFSSCWCSFVQSIGERYCRFAVRQARTKSGGRIIGTVASSPRTSFP